MYRINYVHPISGNCCSRCFKNLNAAYSHIRTFSSSLTFEVIPINVGECYYVHYSIHNDTFIMNTGQLQKVFRIEDIDG